jgi:hypothetical protein
MILFPTQEEKKKKIRPYLHGSIIPAGIKITGSTDLNTRKLNNSVHEDPISTNSQVPRVREQNNKSTLAPQGSETGMSKNNPPLMQAMNKPYSTKGPKLTLK